MWQILTMNIFLSEHKSGKQHYHCWYSFIKFVSHGNLTSADRLMLCWPMRNAVHCVQKADSFKDFKGLIVGSFSHCTSPLAPSPSYSVLTLVQLSHVCTCNACFANHIRKKPIQKIARLFTIPYFFVRSFRYTASYCHGYILIFKCTERAGVGDYSSTVVLTCTHAKWQPVTQSARSRWSYGKIEDCEQSKKSPAMKATWE